MERLIILIKGDNLKINWKGLLRVAGPKVIGLVTGAVSGWIYTKTAGAVSLDPANTEKLIGLIVTMSGAATAASKTSEAFVNPLGAPSPIVAQEGVVVKAQVTAEQKQGESNGKGI